MHILNVIEIPLAVVSSGFIGHRGEHLVMPVTMIPDVI